MTWDATRRIYLDDNGNPVDPEQLREWIDSFIENAKAEVDDHSTQLLEGAITVAAFFLFLSELVTSMHLASAMVAYGGESEMTNQRWGRVDEKLSSEIAYLEAFRERVEQAQVTAEAMASQVADLATANPVIPAGLEDVVRERVAQAIIGNSVTDVETVTREAVVEAIADSVGTEEAAAIGRELAGETIDAFSERLEDLIWGEVESRSRQYMDSVYGQYENSVKAREGDAGAASVRRVTEGDDRVCDECDAAASDEYVSFDEITDIGDTICGGNCRCSFEFEYAGVGPLEIEEESYA